MTTLAAAGWVAAVLLTVCALELRRRLALVADAEHELRGAFTAVALARVGGTELARARIALDDLTSARRGRRAAGRGGQPVELGPLVAGAARAWRPASRGPVELDWRAGHAPVPGDPGRVAQLFGNVVSNAVEHGSGPVRIAARRIGESVRVEVVNGAPGGARPRRARPRTAGRGRGLRIASRAARDAGGTLRLVKGGDETVAAVVELPVER